jgi:hypothetical protein
MVEKLRAADSLDLTVAYLKEKTDNWLGSHVRPGLKSSWRFSMRP